MFDSKEIARRALLRAEVIKKERAARKRTITAIVSTAASLALIVGLSFALPINPLESIAMDAPGITSGTLLAGGAIGGYVLMGVIGFVLGAAVVAVYIKKSKKD